MTDSARFHIEIPLEQLDQAQETLGTINIKLDPVSDMIFVLDRSVNTIFNPTFIGAWSQYIINRINELLERQESPKRLNQAFPDMPAQTRMNLLTMASVELLWSPSTEPDIDNCDHEALEYFIQTHPDTVSP